MDSHIRSNTEVVFISVTGQTRKFANKISTHTDVHELSQETIDTLIGNISSSYLLVVPSYEQEVLGWVFDTADEFLEETKDLCLGIIATGNKNFAQKYGITGKELAEEHEIEVIHDFEFQGTSYDIDKVIEIIESN